MWVACFTAPQLFAQQKQEQPKKDWREAAKEKLAKMDISSIPTDHLLNMGLFTKQQLGQFRQKSKNGQGLTSMAFTEQSWRSLYQNLTDANLKTEKKYRTYADFAPTSKKQKEDNAVIPIGIINVDATLLDSAQVEQNIKQKEQSKKADGKRYETVYILAASVLQEQVYQANVKFRLSPSLNFTRNDNPITGLEIDFQDGKGFREYGLKEQLIDYTYTSAGTHGLTIKLRSKRGTYLCQTQVNVLALAKPVFQREINVTAQRVKNDPSSPNGRAAALSGGTARVAVGCDNVFDRPIIIVEGFDPNNDNSITDLAGRYSGVFGTMQNQGYDLVFLDFNDGRDYIQNNAAVLTSLINEVNRLKSGNSKLIVVGESMGGLVARYALTEFERQGRNHNVSHYISFDSPHKGANVPVGIQTLAQDVRSDITVNIADFFRSVLPAELIDILNAADTPAAKQMLLHWKGPAPHPEFGAFQTELQNRGFPSQCRNVAIINGSIDPTVQSGGYVPGNEVLRKDFVYVLANVFIRAWTNAINQNDAVSSVYSNFLVIPQLSVKYANLPFNHDLIPGGSRDTNPINPNFRFAFVPTFSGIAYSGPLNNAGDYYISSRNARANGYTPFARVYGDGNNTEHVDVINEVNAWFDLFGSEFGVQAVGGSPNCTAQTVQAPPPLPAFSIPRLCNDGSGVTQATVQTDPGLDGLFDYTWTIQPGNITVNGPSVFITLSTLSSGAATVTCTARSRQNPTLTSSFSQTIRPCDQGYICAYLENEFIYINAQGVSYYARRVPGQQYASTAGGRFVPRSELLANGVPSGVAACFPEIDPRGPVPPTVGNYEGSVDVTNCNDVAGWVYDANNPNASLNIEVLEGNTVVATGTAANFRQDLLNAGKGNGQHGFFLSTPGSVKNGQNRTLSVRVAGTAYILAGSYQTINCQGTEPPPPPPNPNSSYDGHFDYAGCETLSGWVYDANNPNNHLSVEVLGNATVVGNGPAANFRQDLLAAGKGNGEHGFSISTPSALKTGQNQSVSIRVTGTGYILSQSPRTINCPGTNPPPPPPPPSGNYEGFVDFADCGSIGGWVYNSSSPNAHLNVELLDGSNVVTTGVAQNFRQDLLNAGKGNGEHGYGIQIPASLKNGQSHSLSIRVSGTGYVLSNSPRTITCSPSGGRLAASDEVVTGVVVYPNPATDPVTLAFFLETGETADLTVVDLLGRRVYTNRVVGDGKTHQEPVSLRGQDAGTFIVWVATDKRKLSGKIVLTR